MSELELVIEITDERKSRLFRDPKEMSGLLKDIRDHVSKQDADISTAKGRASVKALAASIARSKTQLDEFGKLVKSEWQKKVDDVDAQRRVIRDSLDELKTTTRAPLTEYEDEQKRLDNEVEAAFDELAVLKQIPFGADLDLIKDRFEKLAKIKGRNDWRGKEEAAAIAIDAVAETLRSAEKNIQIEDERRKEQEAARRRNEELQRQLDEQQAAREAELQQQQQKQAEQQARIDALERAKQKAEQEVAETKERAEREALAEKQRIEREEIEKKADQKLKQSVKDEIISDIEEVCGFIHHDFADIPELIYSAIENGSIRHVQIA